MSGKLLSGAELFASLQPVDVGLPQRGGQKHYCPEDTWLQEKQLDLFRRERRDVLQEERIGKDGSLNKGEWKPDLERVELLKERGKVWEHYGYVHQGKKLLFPEEAMFLVDQGQMELQYSEVTLSVQEAHKTLLAERIPLLHYQVYARLSRGGYILRRHDKNLIVTGYEKKLRMDHHRSGSRKNRKRKKKSKKEDEPAGDDSVGVKVAKVEGEKGSADTITTDTGSVKSQSSVTLESWIQKDSDEGSAADSLKTGNSGIPHSNWNFSDVCFPVFNASSGEVVLNKPADTFLPEGTLWPLNLTLRGKSKRPVLKFASKSRSIPKSYEDALEFSQGGSAWKKATKAKNWKEFKQEQRKKITKGKTGLAPAAHLWEDAVTPLLKPEEAVSTCHILDKIKVVPNVNMSSESSQLRISKTGAADADIVYDIYLPNKKFRKSDPGPPHFRTCIVNAKDEFPSPAQLFGAMKKCADGIPLLWAIVDNGDIAFYCFHDVDIPQDIVMG